MGNELDEKKVIESLAKAEHESTSDPSRVSRKVIEEDGSATYYDQTGARVKQPHQYKLSSRTIAQREEDLKDIERYFLRGLSYAAIAEALIEKRHSQGNEGYSITREMVTLDCKEVMVRWRESYLKDAGEWFDREMARLDKVEAEYWDAWERSKERKRLMEVEEIKYGGESLNPNEVSQEDIEDEWEEQDTLGKRRKKKKVPPRVRTKVTDTGSEGDVEYLKGVERVIDQRLKILGMGQTRNVNINWRKQAESEGVDPDELMGKMIEAFIKEGDKK